MYHSDKVNHLIYGSKFGGNTSAKNFNVSTLRSSIKSKWKKFIASKSFFRGPALPFLTQQRASFFAHLSVYEE